MMAFQQSTFVVVGVHGTDPVLRIIHDLYIMIPGATQLLSGYVASLTNWPLQMLQTNDTSHKDCLLGPVFPQQINLPLI